MRAGTETYTKRQQQTEVPLHPHIPYLPFWNSTFVLVLLLQGLLSPQTSTHPPPPPHTHPVCNFKPFNNRGSLPSTATGRTRNRAEVGSFELGLARTLPQTSKCLSLMRTCLGGGRPRSLAYPPVTAPHNPNFTILGGCQLCPPFQVHSGAWCWAAEALGWGQGLVPSQQQKLS